MYVHIKGNTFLFHYNRLYVALQMDLCNFTSKILLFEFKMIDVFQIYLRVYLCNMYVCIHVET